MPAKRKGSKTSRTAVVDVHPPLPLLHLHNRKKLKMLRWKPHRPRMMLQRKRNFPEQLQHTLTSKKRKF
ncbi:hypothetical protein DPMN_058697 [Dreissena polymorpha]|uniref:Uncharacterized protein n=1 Tax=Dreissena polymorpha TaxID=45954 RepID=A0A9D4C2J5_DREPO|nr:hypothetical protein DPMN_058697 [Dreissena polymorpha]